MHGGLPVHRPWRRLDDYGNEVRLIIPRAWNQRPASHAGYWQNPVKQKSFFKDGLAAKLVISPPWMKMVMCALLNAKRIYFSFGL